MLLGALIGMPQSEVFLLSLLQASEEELFSLFSPIGEILELYILRNSNGKSRGCAFVTYSNKFLAQQAVTQLNGKQVTSVSPMNSNWLYLRSYSMQART